MPEQGINYVERKELLTYEEMVRVVDLLTELGITKLRITGGEPFLRRDMLDFLQMVCRRESLSVHLTTNGTLTHPHIPALKELGISSVNLSLDTLRKDRFKVITRRDVFDQVIKTFQTLLEYEIPTKVNMVVMAGRNDDDIVPMATLASENPVSIRFIEEMPFNGTGEESHSFIWDHIKIYERLKTNFPSLRPIPSKHGATAAEFHIDGFVGNVGIIASYSRTFCGSCNRLRITPKGTLRTCLYDQGIFNIRDMMRAGSTDSQIQKAVVEAMQHRAIDGFEAEKLRLDGITESMSTIGG